MSGVIQWPFEAINLAYILIVNIIITAILFGIIIDTFADIRQKQEEQKWLQDNFCFICGNERRALEMKNFDFDQHAKDYHSPEKYIWLIVYLTQKPKVLLTELEAYIWEYIKSQDIRFLPVQKFLILSQTSRELQVQLHGFITQEMKSLESQLQDKIQDSKDVKNTYLNISFKGSFVEQIHQTEQSFQMRDTIVRDTIFRKQAEEQKLESLQESQREGTEYESYDSDQSEEENLSLEDS